MFQQNHLISHETSIELVRKMRTPRGQSCLHAHDAGNIWGKYMSSCTSWWANVVQAAPQSLLVGIQGCIFLAYCISLQSKIILQKIWFVDLYHSINSTKWLHHQSTQILEDTISYCAAGSWIEYELCIQDDSWLCAHEAHSDGHLHHSFLHFLVRWFNDQVK